MIESYLRQSALAHLGLESRGAAEETPAPVRLEERVLPAAVNLRGDKEDPRFLTQAKQALGLDLPQIPNTASRSAVLSVLWLGPDEWLVVQHGAEPQAEEEIAERLRQALSELHASVTAVGESLVCIRLAGPRAIDVIAKGCPLDLHLTTFGGAGHCAQSHLSKTAITLHQVSGDGEEGPAFDLYTRRSFADYLWRWLSDAAREFAEG